MKKILDINLIAEIVCKFYKVELDYVFQKSGKQVVCEKRQIIHYLSYEFTELSYKDIGNFHPEYKYDHATVLNSCRKIKTRLEVEKPLQRQV
ncbi:MAG TPA: helix-turn-helix domain-containing protein, partial [Flavobacteriaceae bacterium]|nr:helix-turn-helix domain-containing protein [Flavobacteriaceae bacterium]